MAKTVQLKRGTTAQVNAYIGPPGEVIIDTDKDVTVVQDGISVGGYANAARANPDGSITVLNRAGITQATVDSLGNVGLGVTPSAWNANVDAIDIGVAGAVDYTAGAGAIDLRANSYNDTAGQERYKINGFATLYRNSNQLGQHQWFTAPSGTAGAPITFTQVMTLTQGGNLLVGTTASPGSPNARIVASGTTDPGVQFASTGNGGGLLLGSPGGGLVAFTYTGAVGAETYTERARITSGGYFKASNTGVYVNAAASYHEMVSQGPFALVNSGRATSGGDSVVYSEMSTSNAYLRLYDGFNGPTRVYQVLANGNVQNTNNSYGAISDAKLKENVTDATPKLEGLNQLRVVNYNLIGDDLKQIGLIAQEVEQVFPGLVELTPDMVEVTKTRTLEVPAVLDDEGNEVTPATTREETYTEREPNGEVTKSVKYSVLVPMLLKAVQELTARIEALEAK